MRRPSTAIQSSNQVLTITSQDPCLFCKQQQQHQDPTTQATLIGPILQRLPSCSSNKKSTAAYSLSLLSHVPIWKCWTMPFQNKNDNNSDAMLMEETTATATATFFTYLIVPLSADTFWKANATWPGHVTSVPPFVMMGLEQQSTADIYTSSFAHITSSRPRILHALLQSMTTTSSTTSSLLYLDADVVFTSPSAMLRLWATLEQQQQRKNNNVDLVAVLDSKARKKQPTKDIPSHDVCTGFLYLHPTKATLSLLQSWQTVLEDPTYPWDNDQPAFAMALDKEMASSSSSIRFSLLPPDNPHVPSGKIAFERLRRQNKNQTTRDYPKWWLIHNNHIVGYERKVQRFQKYGLWHPSGRLNVFMKNPTDGKLDCRIGLGNNS